MTEAISEETEALEAEPEAAGEDAVEETTVPTIPDETKTLVVQEGTVEETIPEEIKDTDGKVYSSEEISIISPVDGLTYSRTATAQFADDTPAMLTLQENNHWSVEDFIPEKLQSSLIYENVFPDIDLLYTAFGHNIKEQIIVNKIQDAYRYDFLLDLDGLTAIQNEDGSISLMNEQGDEEYQIPAPYMEDDSGERSFDVSYAVTETSQGVILTVEADKDWINQEGRTFPVMIDPTLTVTTNSNSTDIISVYASEAKPYSTKYGERYLYVGTDSSHKEYRSFVQFNNLPELPNNSQITDVTFWLRFCHYNRNNYPELPICVYPAAADKSFSDVTWNNMPSYTTDRVIDYQIAKAFQPYLSWNLTEIAQGWYRNGTSSARICLTMADGLTIDSTHYAYAEFYSEYGTIKPILMVSYRSNTGIEPYYTYSTMSAGRAGTAYIADASGQLTMMKTVWV